MTNITKEESKLYFVAIDGDDVGPQLRDFIINDDIKGAAAYSDNLKLFFEQIDEWLSQKGAKIIFRGGDSVLASHSFVSLEKLVNEIPVGVCDVSVGFGHTPEYAYLALQLAKARGKGRVVELRGAQAITLKTFTNRHLDRRRMESSNKA